MADCTFRTSVPVKNLSEPCIQSEPAQHITSFLKSFYNPRKSWNPSDPPLSACQSYV
jgi:hypothetical protein